MELISIVLLVLIPFFTILYVYFKYSFEYWKSRGVPHDEPTIPYGNTKGFSKTINQALFVKNVYDKYKPTGQKLAGLYFFSTPVAVLLDIKLIKSVMVKDFAHFTDRGLYYNEKDDPISANLFSLDGGPWKKLRAKLSPTFTSGKMKFMFPTVVEVGERFRDCLSKIVQQHDELEIKDLLARFTTDVIGTCAFGIECNSLEDPNAEFRRYGAYTFDKPRHGPGFFILIRGFKETAKKMHVKTFRDDVSEFFMKVVRDTVDYREKNNVSRNDFMDILIKLKNEEADDKTKSITLNELAAQAFVFFLAGFETSSTTLTFCLYELALNPDIQEKARTVIREAYAKHNGKFTYEMMMDMPYIDQVLEETLRKYPPIAVLSRTTTMDYRVPESNLVIEKGVNVLIPNYAIQHDPEYFPDPEKFNPHRFESEETKKPNPMTWLAFGNGPRNCIGLRFGMMQARIGLVTFLNNFEFSLAPGMPVPLVLEKGSLFLSPEGGVRLKVKSLKS